MTPIATEFKHDKFDFHQIAREGGVALYRKSKQYPGKLFETFEVVIVQSMDEHTWPNGNVTPEHEYMPNSEQWGQLGWSLQTLDDAWDKFRKVKEQADWQALERHYDPNDEI